MHSLFSHMSPGLQSSSAMHSSSSSPSHVPMQHEPVEDVTVEPTHSCAP